jgi:tetratricopeptide (TPR) repeat protein
MSRPPFEVAALADIAALPAAGGNEWKPVRAHLGIDAFGINAFTAAAAGDEVIEDHDETGAQAGVHQELYFVTSGAARFTLGAETVDAAAGTFVFVRDPALRRHAVATAAGTTVVVIGAGAGVAFTPSAWEYSFRAEPAAREGDYPRAFELIREALELHPEKPTLIYNLACYEALAGRADEAIEHLVTAIQLDPRCAEWARDDSDFDPIRNRPDFPA